jgi:hypothetical protein
VGVILSAPKKASNFLLKIGTAISLFFLLEAALFFRF